MVQTYGFTIKGGDQVHALLNPTRHGRVVGKTMLVGYVKRQGSQWRNDQTSDLYKTQSAAAKALVALVTRSAADPWLHH